VTAATTGLLIPPSNAMIVYSVTAGSVSIAALFMAGILPGILVGACIMLMASILCVRNGYGTAAAAPDGAAARVDAWHVCVQAVPSLLLVVLIIGGILSGLFTATEAAAVSVAYAFLLTVVFYREIPLRDVPGIFLQSALTTSVVMLLIGASSALAWIMTVANIPQTVSSALMGLSSNKYMILLIINLLLLAVGVFMDLTPALLIFAPILLPVVRELGISDVHFGIIMIANLCIGVSTPPAGTCLVVGCGVGRTTIANVTWKSLPFVLAMIVALMLITYLPFLSTWLPEMMKHTK